MPCQRLLFFPRASCLWGQIIWIVLGRGIPKVDSEARAEITQYFSSGGGGAKRLTKQEGQKASWGFSARFESCPAVSSWVSLGLSWGFPLVLSVFSRLQGDYMDQREHSQNTFAPACKVWRRPFKYFPGPKAQLQSWVVQPDIGTTLKLSPVPPGRNNTSTLRVIALRALLGDKL